MNYLLKFQPPGVLLEVLLKNSKQGRGSCFCSHCLRCRLLYLQNAQEFSTYISPYKLWLVKTKGLKKAENIILDKKAKVFQKLSQKEQDNKNLSAQKKKLNSNKMRRKFESKASIAHDSTNSYNFNPPFNHSVEDDFCVKYSENSIAMTNNSFAANRKALHQEKFDLSDFTKIKMAKWQLDKQNTKGSEMIQKTSSKPILSNVKLCNASGLKTKVNENESLERSAKISTSYVLEIKKEMLDDDYWRALPENNVSESILDKEKFEKFSFDITYYDSYIQYIKSSTDILITNNKLMEAFNLFKASRKRMIWKCLVKQESKNLVNAYNILLNGLADKVQWHHINKVLNWMRNDYVKLNPSSFASILYCLGEKRQFVSEEIIKEDVHNIIKQLFANNISLDDVFSKTKLNKKKTDKILSVIQSVVPYFNIKPVTVNLNSDCPLTKNLYETNNKLKSPLEDMETDSLRALVEEQLLLEKKFLLEVKAVSKGRSAKISQEQLRNIENLKKEWKNSLKEAVIKATKEISEHWPNTDFKLQTYVTCLPVESLVDILVSITEMLLEYSGAYGPSKLQISKMIGSRIFECYQIKKKEITGYIDTAEDLFKKYTSWYLDPRGPAQNSRQAWQMLINDSENCCNLDSHSVQWPSEVIKKVGEYFIDIIIEKVKFTIRNKHGEMTYPILYTLLRNHSSTYREEIKAHPYLSSLHGKVGFDVLSFRADEMPMVCPPKPWRSANNGGYLIISTDFIRKPSSVSGKAIKFRDVPSKLLYPTLDSLNALQGIPWKINENIFDIVLEVFQNGGSKELNVPHFPDLKLPEIKYKGMTLEERLRTNKERNYTMQKNINDYGLWCEALYRLSLVNHFRKRIFWLPQNCDFRGRVYPVPSLLNHIGGDLFRSLLVFAEAKPLGPKGLDWLKIHVINLTGTHKKKSIEKRLAHANEVLPLILDSAEKPLTGQKWWVKAEEPWQTLAGCMEIKKALSHPNPEEYLCNFPIHQDGSCNGLQHYAALGKDVAGAESVNLVPFETPQDVYSVVAEMVDEERKKDAERGVEIAQVLEGFVSRKIVKQTVMTTVYGVTIFGAKRQIWRRLEEITNFPQDYIHPAATYLSEKTFLSIQKMFKSAKEIQEWFINCAEVISVMNNYVEWPTPLGLPVVQHYGKYRQSRDMKKIIVPNKSKQKNAFPPNFIHTLDSCHMMLTALHCEQARITFAAVHDCFWTHPCSVEVMNKICREQFIALHSQPILEELSQFFKKNYLQNNLRNNEENVVIFDAVPKKGEFDLTKIMNSVYFFC